VCSLALGQHSDFHPTCPGELLVQIGPRTWMNGDPHRHLCYSPERCYHN
jgi:hypothetical protein